MKKNESALGSAAGFIGGVAGRVIVIALMVLILFEAVRYSFQFGHDIFYQEPMEAAPGTDIEISLDDNATIEDAAASLKEAELIRNERAFVIQGKIYKTGIYPGEYMLNTSMTTKEMLEVLNTTKEEYEARLKEEEKAEKALSGSDVLGGGSDMVDEEQAAAAANAGVALEVEAETQSTEAQTEPAATAEAGSESASE